MSTIKEKDADWAEQKDFNNESLPLTPQEVQSFRLRNSSLPPWCVIAAQCGVGLVFVGLLAAVFENRVIAVSAAWGVAVVVLPAMLFARGISNPWLRGDPVRSVLGFFVWESVKLLASVSLMVLASRWQAELNWAAMLLTMLLTLKVYWLALLVRPKVNKLNGSWDLV
ncbi:MAG: ATP synthase subunit I [Betaproteobacteria bacterium]|nr:ATP synthase subunit I [Betaproteobacteria bacterium]